MAWPRQSKDKQDAKQALKREPTRYSTKPTGTPPRQMCNPEKDYTPHYYNLQVSPDDNAAEIKRAYRRLAPMVHPDRNPSQKNLAHEATVLLNEGMKQLGRKGNRAQYDTKWWNENYRWEQERNLRNFQSKHRKKSWWRDYQAFNPYGPRWQEEAWVETLHFYTFKWLPTSANIALWKEIEAFRLKHAEGVVTKQKVTLSFRDCAEWVELTTTTKPGSNYLAQSTSDSSEFKIDMITGLAEYLRLIVGSFLFFLCIVAAIRSIWKWWGKRTQTAIAPRSPGRQRSSIRRSSSPIVQRK